MKKLIICFIIVGVACAKETCSLIGIDKDKYSNGIHITEYKFQCTGIKGYDYVEHEVLIKFNQLDGIVSRYYIDDTERKTESYGSFIDENEDGTYKMIGYVDISLYDEFHIEIKNNNKITSYESMEKTLVNKWNRLKKFIPKYSLNYIN